MTTTIADVRVGLAAAVKAGCGLACEPYVLNAVRAPVAMVDRREMDPRLVFGASKNAYPLRVIVFVGGQSEISSQQLLDGYCETSGASSLKRAVESGDYWPSNLVDYCEVVRIGDTVIREVAGVPYLTVEFDVEVCF